MKVMAGGATGCCRRSSTRAGDDAMAPAPQSREEGNEVDAQATAALALRGRVHAMVHGLSVRRGQ